ncbi:MAG: hypothetical protein MR298_10665 [Odoribacter sp.]|nr:hypothetical protein [Odoribacter sp.]MDY3032969.1 hypothetical protein [Odoribacter sp.]
MKMLVISIIVLFICAYNEQDYSGEWVYQTDSSVFSLTLTQVDSVVTGYHASVMNYGNRIDEGDEENLTIRGTVQDGQLTVYVKSTYDSDKPGIAKIVFVGKDSISFKFITPPSGTYWIPDEAVLGRRK